MTLRKGDVWGTTGRVPSDLVLVRSNAELFDVVNTARRAGAPVPPVGLLGGDLWRAVGGLADPARFDGDVAILPIDLVRVEAGGRTAWASAHVVARGLRGWRGPVVAVMNSQYVGRFDVAPRAHPGDGSVDIVEVDGSMPVRERWKAMRRLPLGTHVPHRSISSRRSRSTTIELPAALPIAVDGRRLVRGHSFTITVEPDAITAYV